MRSFGLLALGVMAALTMPYGRPRAADLIPVEKFAEIPLAEEARLSPDGSKIALISSRQGKRLIVIHDLKTGLDKLLSLSEFEVDNITWKTDQRLVLGVFTSTDQLFWGRTGRQDRISRLLAVDADGGNLKNIGEPPQGFFDTQDIAHADPVSAEDRQIHPQMQDRLVSLLDDDPDHILQEIITELPRKGSTPSVFRVDINTGNHQREVKPSSLIDHYLADPSGVVRLGFGTSGLDEIVSIRDSADSDWRTISRRPAAQDQLLPLAFAPDDSTMLQVLASDTTGRFGLWDFDTHAGRLDHLIDGDVAAEPKPVVRNGRLISYLTEDGARKYADPDWQHDALAIRKALPERQVTIIDRTKDGSTELIEASEPYQPKQWWILNRSVRPAQLTSVIETYPDIAEAGIAAVKVISFKARDGLEISALLTLPRNPSNGPIPFVVLPHGGPHECESESFNYEVQFLASRGWGVLQPQFRGSTCHGAEFERAGHRQWGLAMQDDVTDGTRWLIDQKLADPSRICIVGGSYGGYAALEGVVKEPDLYRCAAAWAPIADLRFLRTNLKEYVKSDISLDELGDDPDQLDAVSPARHADRIKVPVLLMHGRTDFTVQVRHTEKMEEALKDAHKSVEAIYVDNADHYRLAYDARLAWLKALERFLGANLGTRGPSLAGGS